MEVSYITALIAGLISFLSPCVLPLVPPYLSFLGGTTFDQLSGEKIAPDVYRRVVLTAVAFVFGFTTVFIMLGATATAIGQLVATNMDILSKIAGVIIIILGLHFLGILRIPLLYREYRSEAGSGGGSIVSAYIIGLAFAFGWTPCIGPVLATILAIAAAKNSVADGISLLFVYSMGLGIPFVAAAVAFGPFMGFLTRFRRHLGIVEKVMGGLLVITGIMFITGSMQLLAIWLLEMFPGFATIG